MTQTGLFLVKILSIVGLAFTQEEQQIKNFTNYASGPADRLLGWGEAPTKNFAPLLDKKEMFNPGIVQNVHIFLFVLKISAKDYFRPLHKVPIMPVARMTSVFRA